MTRPPRRSRAAVAAAILVLLTVSSRTPAGDCNGNGVEDRDEIASGASADCNRSGVPDECESPVIELAPRDSGLALRDPPQALAAADVDLDGDSDIVAGTTAAGTPQRSSIHIFLADGSGGFVRGDTILARSGLNGLVAADIDGGGRVEIVAISGGWLEVFGIDDDGDLVAGHEQMVAGNLFSLALADVTGDGAPDAVATNSARSDVRVFRGRGDGAFDEPLVLAAGRTPYGVDCADVDGDGLRDIVCSNWRSHEISLIRSRGGMDFAPAIVIDAGLRNPRSVVLGDFDGDGDVDIAVADGDSVDLLSRGEHGLYARTATFAVPGRFLAAGDLDRDGDQDLACGLSESNALALLVNDGGALRSRVDLGVSSPPRSIVASDLDGDGAVDLAVGLADPPALLIAYNGPARDVVSVATERYGYGRPPHSSALGDMDGDGDLDVINANGLKGNVSVLQNDGQGRFRHHATSAVLGYLNTVAVADVDGDGDLDAISANHEGVQVYVLLNDGRGFLQEVDTYRGDPSPFMATAGDFDGDGRPDIALAHDTRGVATILLNDGAGAFLPPARYPVGQMPRCVAGADLDGDGDLDLAAANSSGNSVSVLLNRGAGDLQQQSVYPARGAASYVIAADIDADGDEDLVTANPAQQDAVVLAGRGDGTFEDARAFDVRQSPYSVRAGDLDGDGFLDLVTANRENNSVSLLVNSGSGDLVLSSHFAVGSEPRFAPLGDVDGNGSLDIVAANHDSDDISVLRNLLPPPFAGDYLDRLCTFADLRKVASPARGSGRVRRTCKFVVPAREDPSLLPPLFQNTARYNLHEIFLRSVFPERFPGLGGDEYDRLVGRRATRDYYVGTLSQVYTAGAGHFFTFTVYADTESDFREALLLEEVRTVHDRLASAVALRPLAYLPSTAEARRQAETWRDPGFLIDLEDASAGSEYEPYTRAAGYGRVRLLDEAAFRAANASGRFTFQDVLVLDFAPQDIEGVIGGVITGAVQGDLSHLGLRTARRRTPNAFVARAHDVLRAWEGTLVRLEVGEEGYSIEAASVDEAAAFWESSRPSAGELPPVDAEHGRFDELREIVPGAAGGTPPEARFGGKAANFARLQHVLDGGFEAYREPGFAIPMRYYLEFLRAGRIASHRDPAREVSYENYLAEIFAAPEVQSDSELRFALLESLRRHMREHGVVPPGLVAALAARIAVVFGTTARNVRFRSSSNVEDLLEFNGAGLYDSLSVCAADDLDAGDAGPSRCDGAELDERGIGRGLRRVWASLWNFRAVEERTYYRIPHDRAAMAILVTEAFPDELANGVAFTGNPADPLDRRYVVTAQPFDSSVVSPQPGEVPERDLLQIADGEVVHITRSRASSLVEAGAVVLSDDHLRELGRLMARVDRDFPLDIGAVPRRQVLLDFEFKIDFDGSLAVKQVRPFLIPVETPPAPVFALDVAPGTRASAVFSIDAAGRRPAREMLESKSIIVLRSGRISLPTDSATFTGELVDELRFGPGRRAAAPAGPGLFSIQRVPPRAGVTQYKVRFTQEFVLGDGRVLELELADGLDFAARGEVPIGDPVVLDDALLRSRGFVLEARIESEPVARYGSADPSHLPLWRIAAAAGDVALVLHERHRPPDIPGGEDTGQAALVRAEATIAGSSRTVTDYWRLVYTARRHNVDPLYWVELVPPLDAPGIARPVRVIELEAPTIAGSPARLRLLDEALEPIAPPAEASHAREEAAVLPETKFRRGDASADGVLGIEDAIRVLDHLFRGAAIGCLAAADADDSGAIAITDAIAILRSLFQGAGPLPAPAADCGVDPTADTLDCAEAGACR